MRFKATDEQVKQMAANAINAASPMGLGFLHFDPKNHVSADQLELGPHGLSVDYYEGRMVKIYVMRNDDGTFELRDPRRSHQSWAGTYQTASSLIEAVGAEILPEVEE